MNITEALACCNGNTLLFGGNEAWGSWCDTEEQCPHCGEYAEHTSRGQIICNGCDAVKNKGEEE